MKTLADCLKKHGKNLDPGYRKDILDKAARNKKDSYNAFDAEKFAVAAVADELNAERDSIVAQFPEKSPQQQRLDEALSNSGASATIVPANTPSEKALQKVANLFGLKTVFWESKDPALRGTDGFVMGDTTGEIYINTNSNMPIAFTVGHETLHQLKTKHEDLYKFLTKNIGVNKDEFEKYKANWRNERKGEPEADASDSYIKEELIADFLGDQFQNPDFWEKLHQQSPTKTARIIKIVQNIIDKIKSAIRIKGTQHINNFQESQDAMVSAMYEFSRRVAEAEEGNASEAIPGIKYSKVTNKKLLKKLESGKKVKVFRAMQMIDGKLYPPMSAKVEGSLRTPTELNQWEQAVEQPELAKDGKFKLDKANKATMKARYNPYFHTSKNPLNDQFSSAYKRPNLVTVEAEIPESELTSDYKAAGAKDSVGEKQWNTGPVSSKLPAGKKRTVILTRWAKNVRVLPDSEVAENIANILKGENVSVPDNVVTPTLREELRDQGIKISKSRYSDKIKFSRQSTRVPKAKSATEDALSTVLHTDYSTAVSDKVMFAQNVRALMEEISLPTPKGGIKQKSEAVVNFLSDNLLWFHDIMPAALRQRAKLWYDGASVLASKIWADRYGTTAMQNAALIAVNSPGTEWFQNVSRAERLLDTIHFRQDFKWDEKMSQTASRITGRKGEALKKDAETIASGGKVGRINKNTRDSMRAISRARGKTLAEVMNDPFVAAHWIRVFDETHTDRGFNVLTPEGGSLAPAVSARTGKPRVTTWGTFGEIAKGVSIVTNGSFENIHYLLSDTHKVRNFYNNIFDPNSKTNFVTVDTHAVGAAQMRALGLSSSEVGRAFGSKGGTSSITGLKGTYPYYVEAHTRAAAKRDILPREMQSISWESKRAVFGTDNFKAGSKNYKAVEASLAELKKGTKTIDQVRAEILSLAGGFKNPEWAESKYTEKFVSTYNRSAYKGKPAKVGSKKSETSIGFEVAPHPGNKKFVAAWNKINPKTQHNIGVKISSDIIPKVLKEFSTSGNVVFQVGGYEGDANTSFGLKVDNRSLAVQMSKAIGYIMQQESMVVVSEQKTPGTERTGVITIELPEGWGVDKINDLYYTLDKLRHNGEKIVSGHTTTDSKMAILNFGETDTGVVADIINESLNNEFVVQDNIIYSAFVGEGEYGYAKSNQQGTTARGSSVFRNINNLRDEASRQFEKEVRKRVKFSKTNRQGSQGAVLRLSHYGRTKGLKELDPNYHGSGLRGAESKRKESDPDHWVNRTYFGLEGYKKEPGLGSELYTSTVNQDKIYDFAKDPDNFQDQIQGVVDTYSGWAPNKLSIYEQLIDKAGYDGYQSGDVVAMFKPTPVTQSQGVRFSKAALESALVKNDDLYRITLDAIDSGPLDGGCYACAKALQNVIGGELWTIHGKSKGSKLLQGQHVVLKKDGVFWDADGGQNSKELMHNFEVNENVDVKALKPYKEGDVRNVSQDPKLIADLETHFRKELGATNPDIRFSKTKLPDIAEFEDKYDFAQAAYKKQRRTQQTFKTKLNKKLGGKYTRKVKVPAEFAPTVGDYGHRIKVGDTSIYFIAKSESGTIYLPNIAVDKKGTAVGTKFMEALKEVADETSQNISIYKVTNKKFFDKFKWLEKSEFGDLSYKPAADKFVGMSDLMDMWDKNNPDIRFSKSPPVESKAFKKWFKGSKVVNEAGEPLVVYHVTNEKFNKFDPNKAAIGGTFWFTSNKSKIETDETGAGLYPGKEKVLVKAYLAIKKIAGWKEYEKYGVGELKGMGYDGIKLDNNYVAFEPTQIKSTDNKGTFDATNPDIRFSKTPQQKVADKWYSATVKAVENVQQKTVPAKQWAQLLDSAKFKQAGVKPEEVEWSGVKDWLAEQKGKVTKQEVLDYLAENNVQVSEIVKGENSRADEIRNLSDEEFSEAYNEIMAGRWEEEGYENRREAEGTLFDNSEDMPIGEATKFSNWQEPGGKNYKELLLTLPGKKFSGLAKKAGKDIHGHDIYTLDGQEIGVVNRFKVGDHWEFAAQAEGSGKIKNFKTRFNAVDYLWSEALNSVKKDGYTVPLAHRYGDNASDVNRLAHIRFNERTDSEGNRVLFIEETQSDWHQEGRKKGYGGNISKPKLTDLDNPQALFKIKTLEDQYNESADEKYFDDASELEQRYAKDLNKKLEDAGLKGHRFFRDYDGWKIVDPGSVTAAEGSTPQKAYNDLRLGQNKFGYTEGSVPNAPFKKTQKWQLLTIKRMVRYAAENGFDKIAWTTGEMQAARYDLSKQVREVTYNDKTKILKAYATNTNSLIINKVVEKESIEEYIGKEPAKRLIEAPIKTVYGKNKEVFKARSIKDKDLKVGGEKMKAFYDKMLPTTVNDFFNKKKWGKAKVRETEIITKEDKPLSGMIPPKHETAKVLSIPITDKMKDKALTEGMPLFSKTKPVDIKEADKPITESDYAYVIAEDAKSLGTKAIESPSKIWQGLKDVGEDFAEGLDKAIGSISTRLGKIDLGVKAALRKVSQQTDKNSMQSAKTVMPMIRKAKARMTKADHKAWDYARKNSDKPMIQKLVEKYGLALEYEAYRKLLEKLRSDAYDVGLEIGKIDEYAPRILKDAKGFLRALGKDPDWKIISRRLQERADDLGIEVSRLTPEQRAALIAEQLHSGNYGIGGVSAAKQRKLAKIPKELDKYYTDSDTALINHVYSMNKAIEARKFFGKVPERISKTRGNLHRTQGRIREVNKSLAAVTGTEADKVRKKRNELIGHERQYQLELDQYAVQRDFSENIAAYVDELLIKRDADGMTPVTGKQQQQLVDILNARFQDKSTHGLWGAYKNLAYIDTMGSPISAVTQIGDLAWAAYEGGILGTIKYAGKSLVGKSRITKEQLGFERLGQEFADPGKLGGAVQSVFKWTGLTKMDAIGKETLINNAFDRYKRDARKNPAKLRKEITPIFEGETDQVIQDLLNDQVSDNVELLLYSRLLDFQPMALSEMPEHYLKGGNWRVLYMLKSFTIKQFDAFRREALQKIASKDMATRAEGVKNMTKLAMFFVIANAGADEIKDLILGRDTDIEDRIWDNILRLFGASKFTVWKARTEGLLSALSKQVLPPFKLGDSLYKDIMTSGDEKGLEILGSVPIFGKLAYWRAGRGVAKRGDRWDRKLSKEKSKLNKVKDRLDKAKNKSKFRSEHREEFNKLRKISKMQGRLNKYRKVINKLKARPETKSTAARIKALETKRENIIRNYFGRK